MASLNPTLSPFNSAVETGLRTATMLYALFPEPAALHRLVIFDYLLIHSDDVPDGPPGLHPRTPYRSGELLIRRDSLQLGMLLYMSRGLIEDLYLETGLKFSATETTGSFLDALKSEYSYTLRDRAIWVVEHFSSFTDSDLDAYVKQHLGQWGAEFEFESVLWTEGT